MKLSTRTYYGTLLMLNLALRQGKGPVLLKSIAKKENLSEKYLSQIIIPLKASGLVKSFRGPHGGYILGRPLKRISMKEVVEALEGSADLIGLDQALPKSEKVTEAVSRTFWVELGEKISGYLAAVTLADLENECQEKGANSLMYNI